MVVFLTGVTVGLGQCWHGSAEVSQTRSDFRKITATRYIILLAILLCHLLSQVQAQPIELAIVRKLWRTF